MSDPDYHPYYAAADFNDDGQPDFAVVVVEKSNASRRYLVVFNAPFQDKGAPSYFGSADGILVLSRPPQTPRRRLFVGPPYADAAVLEPRGAGYRLIWPEP
jgi:hypothetical protein